MKQKLIFACAALCAALAGCGDSPESLPVSRIKKLVTQELEQEDMARKYVTITTGYFEQNNKDGRDDMVKLQQAGLVTYKVERFAWYNKRERWYSAPTYELQEHFMVSVELTDKGRKLQVDSIPAPKGKEPDLKKVVIDLALYPESKANLDEKWPQVEIPGGADVAPAASQAGRSSGGDDYDVCDLGNDEVQADLGKGESMDVETMQKYVEALKRVHKDNAILKAVRMESTGAFNVRIVHGDEGTVGLADAGVEVKETNAVGRVVVGAYEGASYSVPVTLVYYEDKGWQMAKDIDFSKAKSCEVEMRNKK